MIRDLVEPVLQRSALKAREPQDHQFVPHGIEGLDLPWGELPVTGIPLPRQASSKDR